MATSKQNKSKKNDEIRIETNIYQRYGGSSFRLKMMHKGHTIEGTYDTLEEAQLAKSKIKIRQSTNPISTEIFEAIADRKAASEMTFDKALQKYLKEETPKKAEESYDSEKSRINRIRAIATELDLSDKALLLIDKQDINKILEKVRAGKPRKDGGKVYPTSNDNLLRYITILRHMFNIAKSKKEGWSIPLENPIQKYDFDFPEPNPSRERRLNEGEWDKLFKAFQENEAEDVFLVATLAVETGIRRREFLEAVWENVNLEERALYLPAPITKSRKVRTLALSVRAVKALETIATRIEKKEGKIFAGLTRGRIRTQWLSACKKAGIVGLQLRDLRHEAISSFAENPLWTPKLVEKQAGHSDPRMTARYIQLSTKKFGEMLD